MFNYASPHAPNLMGGAHPGFAPQYAPPPARVGGAMVHHPAAIGAVYPGGYRAYDIVGQAPADQTTWEKVKAWGDKETFGVANKWLVLGAAVIGTTWYGYYAGWFGR